MEIPCKYQVRGCQEAGGRTQIRNHVNSCNFGRIKCPSAYCNLRISTEYAAGHLKYFHKAYVDNVPPDGLIKMKWGFKSSAFTQDMSGQAVLQLATFDGQTFVLNSAARSKKCFWPYHTWVSILGDEAQSRQYKSVIALVPHCDNPSDSALMVTGKVYSIEVSPEEVLEDQLGVLEVNEVRARKMGKYVSGEDVELHVDYRIVRN